MQGGGSIDPAHKATLGAALALTLALAATESAVLASAWQSECDTPLKAFVLANIVMAGLGSLALIHALVFIPRLRELPPSTERRARAQLQAVVQVGVIEAAVAMLWHPVGAVWVLSSHTCPETNRALFGLSAFLVAGWALVCVAAAIVYCITVGAALHQTYRHLS
eukprot:m51a1_g7493 hypothetical protein (165) ;mRNA; f:254556-255384